jgi:hypothetical protein
VKLRCYDIDWDTSDEEAPQGRSLGNGPDEVDLPREVTIEVPDDTDIDEEIADILSDKYGWLIFGVCVERL